MENLDLKEIAKKTGFDYIETTTGMNGYPQNIKPAIVGFNNFDEAQKIADEYGLQIEQFTKKNGWQLWVRTGDTAYEPFENDSSDYGDDYQEYSSSEFEDESEFFEKEVKELLTSCESLDEAEAILSSQKELWENIEQSEDDEIIISCSGRYYETIKKKTMSFHHDSNTKIIGVILHE